MNALESKTTEALKHRQLFANMALVTVWVGATFAIVASLLVLNFRGGLPVETFVMSVIALAASVPAYLERRRIDRVLSARLGEQ